MGELDTIPVFKCNMCGYCCTLSSISTLPHEEVILRAIGEELGIKVNIKAGYTVYEEISDVLIAFSNILELSNGKCVFLQKNKCIIHNIYKPYICRTFPYVPRHVRYTIDDVNKYISAEADYGLSLVCPVVKRDKPILEKHISNPALVFHYIKEEYQAMREAENIRNYLLYLLSKLWREGLVEIKTSRPNARMVNLYEFLRYYYPDLPNRLGVDRVIEKVRDCGRAC
ncbi:MAG: YkgJ family cysteine cluster protein [Desulfurococcaceae archaeon]